MKARARPVFFRGVQEGMVLGHPVKVAGPQTPADEHAHSACCIEIDGNVIEYEIGESGIHSHSYMHANFATPWELAEALIRDYGGLAVRGGPSADAPTHDHDHGGAHDHRAVHDHGASNESKLRRSRRRKGK